MKKIEAIVREDRFHLIKIALEEKGFISMTVSDVIGRGKQKGVSLKWRVGEHRIDFLPKKKIEIVVEDKDCQIVVDTICERGRTGAVGDGKIFILPVEEVVRIRTGEVGVKAI
ncbi:MAG: P-II family nitrogen regulator [Dehalococcoidales bacterium]|jgi:nitrogen regulatory protein P-II 1|nr:P-II family nitrogen regulator [Dehalococcoidales bacterium]